METKCCRTCKYLKKSDYKYTYSVPPVDTYICAYPLPIMFNLISQSFALDTNDFIGHNCPVWMNSDVE